MPTTSGISAGGAVTGGAVVAGTVVVGTVAGGEVVGAVVSGATAVLVGAADVETSDCSRAGDLSDASDSVPQLTMTNAAPTSATFHRIRSLPRRRSTQPSSEPSNLPTMPRPVRIHRAGGVAPRANLSVSREAGPPLYGRSREGGTTMQKWEYHVDTLNMSDRWSAKRQAEEVKKFTTYLNSAGQHGWEMVSYESVPMTGTFTGNVKGYAYLCFFKRPIEGHDT
jgi:hypothetical protein